jgi:lauroyl/myristoyl acyltransferase
MSIGAAFVFVRGLERIFPPSALHRVLTPCLAARVAFKRSRPSLPLPGCLGTQKQFQISKRQRRRDYLNAALEFFPEQLATPKWRDRLKIEGVQHLESARAQKRPVILAFCHFGPYFLLRFWLRAAGFAAATLVEGQSQNRSVLKRLKDCASPFPEIPTAFYQEDQLRETVAFVSTGNPLLIAMDVLSGKQMHVPVDGLWRFEMASGAIRLAMRQQAELIPCSIIDHGGWRFQINLGPPVPAEFLQGNDTFRAGKHLLDAMLPAWRAHPEQCTERLLKLFHPVDSKINSPDDVLDTGAIAAR